MELTTDETRVPVRAMSTTTITKRRAAVAGKGKKCQDQGGN
jgi:hypothetical protein